MLPISLKGNDDEGTPPPRTYCNEYGEGEMDSADASCYHKYTPERTPSYDVLDTERAM